RTATPVPPPSTHRLPVTDIDALARGDCDCGVVDRLWAPQLSKRILLLWALVDAAGRALPDTPAGDCAKQSYHVLAAARGADGEAADPVLISPTVGAWAVHCLRLLRRQGPHPASLADDLGHFGAVAAAAGVRAGVGFDLPVGVQQGAVM